MEPNAGSDLYLASQLEEPALLDRDFTGAVSAK
jgi:hypothetical protein